MKLKYWKARCLDDSDCYSIRTKTRKEALKRIAQYSDSDSKVRFSAPYKVEIEYCDGFDLMSQCLDPCGLGEDENEPEASRFI